MQAGTQAHRLLLLICNLLLGLCLGFLGCMYQAHSCQHFTFRDPFKMIFPLTNSLLTNGL